MKYILKSGTILMALIPPPPPHPTPKKGNELNTHLQQGGQTVVSISTHKIPGKDQYEKYLFPNDQMYIQEEKDATLLSPGELWIKQLHQKQNIAHGK